MEIQILIFDDENKLTNQLSSNNFEDAEENLARIKNNWEHVEMETSINKVDGIDK